MTNKISVLGILLLASAIALAYTLSSVFSISSYTFGMDETFTVDIQMDRSYYLAYNNVYSTDFYDIEETSIYSEVDFGNANMIFVRTKHIESNDYIYLDGFGESRSIKINDQDVIAELHLEAGTNEIFISPASGSAYTLADEFEFLLIPSNFLALTLWSVVLGLSTIVLLAVFLYYFTIHRKQVHKDTTFDGTYHQEGNRPMFDYDKGAYDTYEDYKDIKRRS